jgi:protein involved in polysaccharide export with SLBB domain
MQRRTDYIPVTHLATPDCVASALPHKSRNARLKELRPRWRVGLVCLFLSLHAGCASLTFPISGVPVRKIPTEYFPEPKESKHMIDLALLRQPQPDVYRLGAGDVLGIWIEGVLGEKGQIPPVHYPEGKEKPPAIGFPIPVRDDGTLALPLIEPIRVDGRTIAEVEEAIRDAYTHPKKYLKEGEERTIVTLIRERTYHVLVIRQDGADTVNAGSRTSISDVVVLGGNKRSTGHAVDLPAYKNDVLNALAQTGGLPGLDAKNEIVIHRRRKTEKQERTDDWRRAGTPPNKLPADTLEGEEPVERVRISLRLGPGEKPTFRPEDVVLETGDIVQIESRDTEVFYTAGLLPSGEFPLPRDYDLDVLEAIARVQGPIASGGLQTNNFVLAGSLVAGGIGGPSPSLVVILRKTPSGAQIPIRVDLNRAIRNPRERVIIQPGDVILLQQTPSEAVTRYLLGIFKFQINWQVFTRGDAQGEANVSGP